MNSKMFWSIRPGHAIRPRAEPVRADLMVQDRGLHQNSGVSVQSQVPTRLLLIRSPLWRLMLTTSLVLPDTNLSSLQGLYRGSERDARLRRFPPAQGSYRAPGDARAPAHGAGTRQRSSRKCGSRCPWARPSPRLLWSPPPSAPSVTPAIANALTAMSPWCQDSARPSNSLSSKGCPLIQTACAGTPPTEKQIQGVRT